MHSCHGAGTQGRQAAGDQPGAHISSEESERSISCLSLLHGRDMLPTAAQRD